MSPVARLLPEKREILPILIRVGGFTGLFALLVFAFMWLFFVGGAPNNLLAQIVPVCLAGLLASLIALRLDGRRRLAFLGLPLSGSVRGLAGGLFVGVAFIAVPLLVAVAGGLRYGLDSGTWIEYAGTGLWATMLLLVASAGEEFLFRGYPLRVLVERWGRGAALALTSAAFALVHGWNPNVGVLMLLNIVLAGVLLGMVCLNTGSLWWAIGVHAGWNLGTGFVADLPVSGMRLIDAPLIEVSSTGMAVITGGAAGLEGGVASTVGLALAILLVARRGVTPSGWFRGDRKPDQRS